jgi:hypothetical protein
MAQLVNGIGNDFLASPGFTQEQDRCIRLGYPFGQVRNVPHRR